MCRPDADDLDINEWRCRRCGNVNSDLDAVCQYCDPEQDRADYARDHKRDYRKHDRCREGHSANRRILRTVSHTDRRFASDLVSKTPRVLAGIQVFCWKV